MEQDPLKPYTVEGLREMARQYELDVSGTRPVLVQRLVEHFDKVGWPESVLGTSSTATQTTGTNNTNQPVLVDTSQANRTITQTREGSGQRQGREYERNPRSALPFDIQEIVRAVQSYEESQMVRPGPATRVSSPPSRDQTGTSTPTNVYQNWSQIKFISKLIPTFSGKDEENIERWLERVAAVARTYGTPEECLVIAAVNQLQDRALNWYNRQPVESVASWENFMFQIRRYFERKESYTTTLSRVSSRFWKTDSERFIEYAENKLQLMQFLNQTEKGKIELLADGVREPSLRRLVLNTWVNTVPEFLEHVRKITEDSTIQKPAVARNYKTNANVKPAKATNDVKTCFACKKPGHIAKDCTVSKTICFKCGVGGHYSSQCPKKNPGQNTTLNHLSHEDTTTEVEATEEATEDVPKTINRIADARHGDKSCV